MRENCNHFATARGPSGVDKTSISKLAAAYLRDACQCSRCVDPSSKQKLFETADIPKNINLASSEYNPESLGWNLTFDGDISGFTEHVGFVPDRVLSALTDSIHVTPARTVWNSRDIQQHPSWVDFQDYQDSDTTLLGVLRRLHSHGLVFLRNVPEDEGSVIKIAERIGVLRDTFYGRTFNVRSVPDAKNIAYTNQYLGLHMDLLPFTNPPHLQFLHSLRARASGGESLFSDSFLTAETMRREEPRLFTTLCREPITFHYDHYPSHNFSATRTVIELDIAGMEGGHGGIDHFEDAHFLDDARQRPNAQPQRPRIPHISHPIKCINWSPPFQAPLRPNLDAVGSPEKQREQWQRFSEALRMFKDMVNAEENVFKTKLQEGDCVIFDNRRVLHARKAFDPRVGERWLRGAYIDDDVFYSKLRVLSRAEKERNE